MIFGTAERDASSVSVEVCIGRVWICGGDGRESSLGSLGGGVCEEETEMEGGSAGTGGGGAESEGGGNLKFLLIVPFLGRPALSASSSVSSNLSSMDCGPLSSSLSSSGVGSIGLMGWCVWLTNEEAGGEPGVLR